MKKIISNNELKEKMKYSINLLCDTVKTTLGPTGNNVIIDHSSFTPFITNDGVTIAENIESEDEVVNTILSIAKEASIKTNEDVGDGTTTTLVLLQSIFNEGLKTIGNGVNPIQLKKELLNYLDKIINLIKLYSFKPNKEDLCHIASTSCNDKELGKIISDAYYKTKNKGAIKIKEINYNKVYVNYIKGYTIDTQIASPYYLNDGTINYNNPYLLLINDDVINIDNLIEVINYVISNKEKLIIIANSYSEQIINELISLYLDQDIKIILLTTPEYGTKQFDILKDLSIIYNMNISNKDVSLKNIKRINSIKIDKESTIFTYNKSNNIKLRINELKHSLNNNFNEIDKNFIKKRIYMLNNELAEINIGSNTETELRELKMRVEDALCALESTKSGISIGSGIIFLKISKELKDDLNATKILKKALEEPFKQILINSGLNYNEIINEIINNNYNCLYNIKSNSYEYNNYTILDSTNILIKSLVNATSIASMLLTTTSLIINEYNDRNITNTNIEL